MKAILIIVGSMIIRIMLIMLLSIAGVTLLICAIISIQLFDYAALNFQKTLSKRFVQPVLAIINGI